SRDDFSKHSPFLPLPGPLLHAMEERGSVWLQLRRAENGLPAVAVLHRLKPRMLMRICGLIEPDLHPISSPLASRWPSRIILFREREVECLAARVAHDRIRAHTAAGFAAPEFQRCVCAGVLCWCLFSPQARLVAATECAARDGCFPQFVLLPRRCAQSV